GTHVGGIPEIIIDGVDGYLIPPRSPQAIAAAVLKLLDDPVKARAMGEAARAIVEKEFSIDAMVAGNLGVYRELMDTL
ncbi:MAG TPA: glycosyltransferase, partial [Gammaproteobacteria bacterium]